jgi:hypothetical protein
MPIPIEKIQVVEDEIEREHKAKDSDDDDDDDNHYNKRHTTTITPPDQDFSFLKNSSQAKRSVRYGIEQMDNHEHQPLQINHETEQADNGLRRRYIAHWGLPGSLFKNFNIKVRH